MKIIFRKILWYKRIRLFSEDTALSFGNNDSVHLAELNLTSLSDFLDVGGSKTLKLATLKTCGVLSKLKFSEFSEFINTFDVICLVETKIEF